MPTDPKLLLHLSFKFGERKRKTNKDVANKKRCKPTDQKSDEKPYDRGMKSMGTSKAVRSETNTDSKPSTTAHQQIESQPPSDVLRTPMKTGAPDADATGLSSPSPQDQGPLINPLDLFRLHTKRMEEKGVARVDGATFGKVRAGGRLQNCQRCAPLAGTLEARQGRHFPQ
ncbi:hypothetical protein PGT21_015665 [Puccinia graminis f. sp. tritici]|uniref:Uncharacterized protein n=1 Tax=Puccinia graminis f. sp. tritici TaxID=56615 RepID=A0A5B0MM43_PUCGR|nr:hypothetical protein PGT21_015665 [Puccinia graminis f. sp. tritici]